VSSSDFRNRLIDRAFKTGLVLPDSLVARLSAYYELLARWNRTINLTSLHDPDASIGRLLLEPIIAVRHFPSETVRMMDVGSGGGSPAIPMKLAAPGASLMMVEAKSRKSAFLREAIRTLELTSSSVETSRYERLLTRPELLGAFDLLSIRAVRLDERTISALQAFIRPGGLMFLFRGPGAIEDGEVVPPMSLDREVPLVPALQSQLRILRKC